MPKGVFERKQRTHEQKISSLRKRLEQLSEPVTESGCILFVGCENYLGYGVIAFDKKTRMSAHRASFMVCHGEIPAGMDVRHKCDVRCCINPLHLELGTHQQNMRDMVLRGRSPCMPGELHPNAKLSDDLVKFIRSSQESARSLARQLGLSKTTILRARTFNTWKHVA
jgi:hypothetical protein